MRGLFKAFLFGLVVAAIAMLAANYRVVITSDSTFVARKSAMGFEDTLVDTRDWGAGDYLSHPAVTAELVSRGLKKAVEGNEPPSDNARDLIKKFTEKSKDAIEQGFERTKEAVGQ